MQGLRRKVLRIADQAWPMFLGERCVPAEVVEGGLPEDARCVGCSHDGRTTAIVFESASFEPVEEGDLYPVIEMKLRRVEPRRTPGGESES